MKTFLHIGFRWEKDAKVEELKPVFDKALDWLRYAPNCWIVWTSSSPHRWYERLKSHLGPGDHVFICELNLTHRQGWLPKWVWEWLNKERQ